MWIDVLVVPLRKLEHDLGLKGLVPDSLVWLSPKYLGRTGSTSHESPAVVSDPDHG
jgi:hypothetical protein